MYVRTRATLTEPPWPLAINLEYQIAKRRMICTLELVLHTLYAHGMLPSEWALLEFPTTAEAEVTNSLQVVRVAF